MENNEKADAAVTTIPITFTGPLEVTMYLLGSKIGILRTGPLSCLKCSHKEYCLQIQKTSKLTKFV